MKKPATKPPPKPRRECVVTGTPPRAVAVFTGRTLTAVAYLEPVA